MTVRVLGIVLSIVLVGFVAEGGSFLVVRVLSTNPQTRSLVYQPPSIPPAQYADYLRRRDPVLGWPPPDEIGGASYDETGARRTPAFPQPGRECITTYGDSFTYASDVGDADAWANVLSRLLNCRVGNFGVGGYGTDQAYLRFERNPSDRAPVTLLGIYPDDAIRNLTRDAYLAFGLYPASFKPRFDRVQGKLVLLPMPTIPSDRLADYFVHPERFLADDRLLPGTPFGPVRAAFPYTAALLRIALGPRIRNWVLGRPSWMSLYTPGDASGGLEAMEGIVGKFAALCHQRDKRCAVLLFPTPKSYAYFEKTGRSALADLSQRLDRLGMPHLDLAAAISRDLAGRPYCDLVDRPGNCAGHYNARGNELVAKLVRRFLSEQPDLAGRLPRSPPD